VPDGAFADFLAMALGGRLQEPAFFQICQEFQIAVFQPAMPGYYVLLFGRPRLRASLEKCKTAPLTGLGWPSTSPDAWAAGSKMGR
jgi:hypothetical protein